MDGSLLPAGRRRGASWLARLAMVCAVVVLLGSCDFRSTRVYPAGGDATSATTQQDGAGRWAAVTFLCGGVALGVLALAAAALRFDALGGTTGWCRIGAALAALAAAALALAAVIAGRYWQGVLDQRDSPMFTIEIAGGLPVVTLGGAAGAVAALLLAVALSLLRVRGGAAKGL